MTLNYRSYRSFRNDVKVSISPVSLFLAVRCALCLVNDSRELKSFHR